MTIKEIRKIMRHYRDGNEGHQVMSVFLVIMPLIVVAIILCFSFILRKFNWLIFRVLLSMLIISGIT